MGEREERVDSDDVQAVFNKFNGFEYYSREEIRFDESRGAEDGDPILTQFVEVSTICDACKEIINDPNKKDPQTRPDQFNVHLDDVIKGSTKSEAIIKDLTRKFGES